MSNRRKLPPGSRSRSTARFAAIGLVAGMTAIVPTGTAHHHARGCPTGSINNPYNLRTQNGPNNPFAYFNSDSDGEAIRSGTNGRDANWHSLGCTSYGSPMGYWKSDSGKVWASNDACTGWVLKPHESDYGTVTIDLQIVLPNGKTILYFGPRYCNPNWNDGTWGVTDVLRSDDVAGHAWSIADRLTATGYMKMLVCNSSGKNCIT